MSLELKAIKDTKKQNVAKGSRMAHNERGPIFFIGLLFGLMLALVVSIFANLALLKKAEKLELEKRIMLELYGNEIIKLPLLSGEKEILEKAIKKIK